MAKATLFKIAKLTLAFFLLVIISSCKKDAGPNLRYFEVGVTHTPADWRDSSFVVATADQQLIKEIEAQLKLPVSQRKIVNGALAAGNGGYNRNASHNFKWHFKEDQWNLTEVSIEIYDGRPFSDVDTDLDYWLNTGKRFSPWSSYIKREIIQ